MKLPAGPIDGRGFGARSREVSHRNFSTLDQNTGIKDVTSRLGNGQRVPRDRFQDVQFKYDGKTQTLADFIKDGYEKYRWYAWTDGRDTMFLGFTTSDPHFLAAKFYFGPPWVIEFRGY